jgi:hypothetical protein
MSITKVVENMELLVRLIEKGAARPVTAPLGSKIMSVELIIEFLRGWTGFAGPSA